MESILKELELSIEGLIKVVESGIDAEATNSLLDAINSLKTAYDNLKEVE